MIDMSVKKNKRQRIQRTLASLMLFNILCFSAAPAVSLAAPNMLATADTTNATEDKATTEKATTNNAKPDKVPSIDQLGLDVSSAVLIEPSTGQVLLSVNADEALPPASMTKMMTEYIVAEKVKQGELAWDDVVTVGENAAKTVGSRIFLAEGDQHTVEELYIAMAVGSANDATVALAEHVAGSEEEFVAMMNDTAKKMGLKTAFFINSTGLSRADMPKKYRPEEDKETVMSAMDTALLAKFIVEDHPDFARFTAIQSHKFRDRDTNPIINYNWMLEANKDITNFKKYAYEGLDGLKTGHTNAAKYCFAGTAERDGMRLISVVMGTKSEGARFVESKKVLDYGFDNFEVKEAQAAGATVQGFEKVEVKKGKGKEAALVTDKAVTFVVPKGSTGKNITFEAKQDSSSLTAPVAKDTKVGTVTYTYKIEGMKDTQTETVNLITAEEVEKAGWFSLFLRAIGDFFADLFDSIKNLF
ncbi:D-alanyl-D-alanine carboxypeptidase family protein [Paenibacillus sp. ISL-20]|uniref:D-alanyl-D-alanine carboxypeptidase family protein n=1 Tax=Paenibacillus sp. ISL-20 TaxID=2819163 RepID=UPI001BEACB29|nr:D-alanyl-D-alanine carboxypeptidase family protein [Paenibacillus sp. ISL-20]MBT2765598.1 D-alanyl-D-alanine carboxypeptidase [Paenibacillus sp. ISL-20]